MYETVRIEHGIPYFLVQHLERLIASALAITLAHPFSLPEMREWISALIAQTSEDTYNLKILLIGAPQSADTLLVILPSNPRFPDRKLYRDGATAMTVPYERPIPHAKTLNMLLSYLAYCKAQQGGFYEALAVNRDGCITEGTRTNFFALRGTTIFSPPREDILEGVSRAILLNSALQKGFSLLEQPIPLDDLPTFDGAFLTSTSSKVMPLRKIDDVTFTITPSLHALMEIYEAFWKNCHGQYI